MEEVYRGYRIAVRLTDAWRARITHVRGPHLPLDASASIHEGDVRCAERAREVIDRYLAFIKDNGPEGDPN